MTAWRMVSQTKLYWGLALIFLVGAISSPVTSSGRNIFLSYGNLTDVLRQVSITGLVATGMTIVILIGGIDLSVGSLMAFGTVVTAMLLTQAGWTGSALLGVPVTTIVAFVAVAGGIHFLFKGVARGKSSAIGHRADVRLDRVRGRILPIAGGGIAAALVLWFLIAQVPGKFGVLGVLLVAPCVGLLFGIVNGLIIVGGRLQPFIVTLAMMVAGLGSARLLAGQDSAVLPVYTGTNATEAFEALRAMAWGVVPVPGLFFLAAVVVFGCLLRFTAFGRYVYAIGGNEDAARLSGVDVVRVKLSTYAISGMLAGIAGVLFVAQYRQGKPDAGQGLELDAIAAVVIGGTSLMGGRGGLVGTLVGVLIFGLLSDILQLHNINSNLQLVLKGLIIVCTVLVQERNLGQVLAAFGFVRRSSEPAAGTTGPATFVSPAKTNKPREELHETP